MVQILTYLDLLLLRQISSSWLPLFLFLIESLCICNLLQLGLGHTNHVREPTLVTVLQGKNVRQISAGRCHSAAWTAPPVPPRAPGEGWNIHAPAASLSAVPSCTLCLPVSVCIQTWFWNHQTCPHKPKHFLCYQHCKYFHSKTFFCNFFMKQFLSAPPKEESKNSFRAATNVFLYIKKWWIVGKAYCCHFTQDVAGLMGCFCLFVVLFLIYYEILIDLQKYIKK